MIEITIPVLNEEETLEKNTLIALRYVQQEVTPDFKIIIANNGSTDRTEEIAIQLKNKYPEVEYLYIPRRGVGLALKTSWLQSGADIVGYMDLDLATDLSHLKEAYDLLDRGEYEIVNGSRLLASSKVIGRKQIRNITSRGFNILVRLILGVGLSDGMCGFKFFKRKVAVELISSGIEVDGWFFSTEILVRALWARKKLIEIPVNWKDDSASKVNILQLTREYTGEIIRMYWNKKKILYQIQQEIK